MRQTANNDQNIHPQVIRDLFKGLSLDDIVEAADRAQLQASSTASNSHAPLTASSGNVSIASNKPAPEGAAACIICPNCRTQLALVRVDDVGNAGPRQAASITPRSETTSPPSTPRRAIASAVASSSTTPAPPATPSSSGGGKYEWAATRPQVEHLPDALWHCKGFNDQAEAVAYYLDHLQRGETRLVSPTDLA
ncbi:hypothetical protein ONZ45_g10698 [Pleurotus djamor]|nr:hypothetical protein ONZ45_g10698 [Pleurotus djamor]